MNVELALARTWIVVAAMLVLFITGGGAAAFREYYRRWKAKEDDTLNSQAWTALVITVMLDVLLFAVLNVGQAFELVSEGWGAIVGISTSILLPILGYKSVQNITAGKTQVSVVNQGANNV